MTVHINQFFALMDQNHGGEKKWRNMCVIMSCAYIFQEKYAFSWQIELFSSFGLGRRW